MQTKEEEQKVKNRIKRKTRGKEELVGKNRMKVSHKREQNTTCVNS